MCGPRPILATCGRYRDTGQLDRRAPRAQPCLYRLGALRRRHHRADRRPMALRPDPRRDPVGEPSTACGVHPRRRRKPADLRRGGPMSALDLATLHEAIADELANEPCVIAERTLTWHEITDRTRRLAALLRAHGLGDRRPGT